MRIFIIRQHTVDGPGRPYNQSYFVSSGTVLVIILIGLMIRLAMSGFVTCKRGREVFQCFSKEIQKMIELIANHIPPMLKRS